MQFEIDGIADFMISCDGRLISNGFCDIDALFKIMFYLELYELLAILLIGMN